MTVREQIRIKLLKLYSAAYITAGYVTKGTNFDGVVQNTGWWFVPFLSKPLWLGKNKKEVFETIDQIAEEKNAEVLLYRVCR